MAIIKNILWDSNDNNNTHNIKNVNNYYKEGDYIYGSDLNLLLSPLTHALQYYPLYDYENNEYQRAVADDNHLLAPLDSSATDYKNKPTLFRLSYQHEQNGYEGDVNVVFDNEGNNKVNLVIDGDFEWENGSLNTFYYNTTSGIATINNAGTYWRISESANDDILLTFARNQVNNTIENSYTEVFSNLRLYTLHKEESEEYGDWNSAKILTLKPAPNNERGTLLLRPGTIAIKSELDDLKTSINTKVPNVWLKQNMDTEAYEFGSTIKGIYQIQCKSGISGTVIFTSTICLDSTASDFNVNNILHICQAGGTAINAYLTYYQNNYSMTVGIDGAEHSYSFNLIKLMDLPSTN